jgi:hypothetical protein
MRSGTSSYMGASCVYCSEGGVVFVPIIADCVSKSRDSLE